jgi:hypothetical protein
MFTSLQKGAGDPGWCALVEPGENEEKPKTFVTGRFFAPQGQQTTGYGGSMSWGEDALKVPGYANMNPAEKRRVNAECQRRAAVRDEDVRWRTSIEDRLTALEGTAHSEKQKRGGHGGAREGAGRPEGSQDAA